MIVPHKHPSNVAIRNDASVASHGGGPAGGTSLIRSHSLYKSFFGTSWKRQVVETPKEVELVLAKWRGTGRQHRDALERKLVHSLREKIPKEVVLIGPRDDQQSSKSSATPAGTCPQVVGSESHEDEQRHTVSFSRILPGRPSTPTISPVSLTAVKDIAMRREITQHIIQEHEARVEVSQRQFRERHERRLNKLSKEIEQVHLMREANLKSMHDPSIEAVATSSPLLSNSAASCPPFAVRCIDYCRGDGVVKPLQSGIAETPRHIRRQVMQSMVQEEVTSSGEGPGANTKTATKKKKQRFNRLRALPELAAARRRVLNDDPNASYWDSVVAEDKYRRAASASLVM